MTGFPAISLPPGNSTTAMQPPFTSGRRGGRCKGGAAPKQGIPGLFMQGGRELTKNGIEAMITDITATTAEAEDYTGEDGLLYCGKCHTPKEAYFAEERPVSGVTATGRVRLPAGSP